MSRQNVTETLFDLYLCLVYLFVVSFFLFSIFFFSKRTFNNTLRTIKTKNLVLWHTKCWYTPHIYVYLLFLHLYDFRFAMQFFFFLLPFPFILCNYLESTRNLYRYINLSVPTFHTIYVKIPCDNIRWYSKMPPFSHSLYYIMLSNSSYTPTESNYISTLSFSPLYPIYYISFPLFISSIWTRKKKISSLIFTWRRKKNITT